MEKSTHPDDRLIIITGRRRDNNHKFRPSDWAERLACVTAAFGSDNKLRYAQEARPCMIDGEKCLAVTPRLRVQNPGAYDFLMAFAQQNRLHILEERHVEGLTAGDEGKVVEPTLQNPVYDSQEEGTGERGIA